MGFCTKRQEGRGELRRLSVVVVVDDDYDDDDYDDDWGGGGNYYWIKIGHFLNPHQIQSIAWD